MPAAEPAASGVPGEIRLGTTTVLSGPAADLGHMMVGGMQAGIAEINNAGGVHGHPVRLIALDDGYEPERAVPNMHELIESEQVVTIIGNVGTPTAIAALPIALKLGVPFFAPYTGAGILRHDPPDHFVINVRASYAEETAAMVDALVTVGGLRPEEIAFFTQRDAYGDSGFSGGLAALKRHGLASVTSVCHGRYERNTLVVDEGLATILGAATPPRAIIMVGTYAPCAKFISEARGYGLTKVLFLNVSFVGATSLAATLGVDGNGVIITQVVPHFDSDVPIARDYRAAIALMEPAPEPSFAGLEGYVAVRVLRLALDKIDGPVGREAVVTALESLGTFDIGEGEPLHLDADQHQASHHVWATVVKDGRVLPFDWSHLAELLATPR